LQPRRWQPGAASTFTVGTNDFLLDGKPFLIRCGEMHFAVIIPNPKG